MEKILHYIWQHKLFVGHEQRTICGMPIEVIDVGRHNTDAGADFFNAKIKIGDTTWIGNVEIHVRASDWELHKHQHDKAYNNVILHVVDISDKEVTKQNGEIVTQCQLSYPAHVTEKYNALCDEKCTVRCADKLSEIPDIFISTWKDRLLTERLEQKTDAIERLLNQNENYWEEAFYITLARSFGFHVNSLPFELLAKSLPLHCIGKHKNDLLQIEAMLYGQAGLLENVSNEYGCKLQQEYSYLKQKFSLTPIDGSLWKMLRLRPDNFPHIRIAEFAALLHQSNRLLSVILSNLEHESLVKLFQVRASKYWDTHYTFSESSTEKQKQMGKSSIDILLINTIVPFAFAYAQKHNDEALQEKALDLLNTIKPEQNSIITKWKNAGMSINNAYDTQAYLQLTKHYCQLNKCIDCRIGHKILQVNPNK